MMSKKYIVTDNTHPQHPTTKQIMAIRDIPSMNIKKGDLGGFIETEYNLAQTDNMVRNRGGGEGLGSCVIGYLCT